MQKRYVIYSAMVGAYDDILQPKVVDERFDYILFSNDIKEERVGVWEVLPIAYHNDDRTRICRYVKTHPEEMVPGYEVSIWMDSNVQILTDYFYKRVIELDEKDVLVSSMWHPTRHCIYEEAFAVMRMGVEHEDVVVDWCHKLRKESYPRNNGLCETCVLYRKQKNELVNKADALWWSCIEQHSRRDQLSFNYVLWKTGITVEYFLGEGTGVENTEHLSLAKHKDIKRNNQTLRKNEAWLIRHLWRSNDEKRIKELYYRLYAYPCPKFWVALAGQYYRLVDRLKRR